MLPVSPLHAKRMAAAEARRARVVELLDEGYGAERIAEITGSSLYMVKQDIKASGRVMSNEDREQHLLAERIRQAVAKGMSAPQIAEAQGCSKTKIRDIARKHEIRLPQRGRKAGA
ncbi:hypothetical protein [Frigidibacter sp. MR17.24]|uniref:hypothetical protein n=1 Tax=Frigidibacter sp. MR17.24 TaxID=3127345 RepID=UPI003012D35D